MRELNIHEVEEVSGGIVPILIAIAAHSLVRVAIKAAVATAVAVTVGTSVNNALK